MKVMSRSAMIPAASLDMQSTGKELCPVLKGSSSPDAGWFQHSHYVLFPIRGLNKGLSYLILYLTSLFPFAVLRPSMMASSTQWSWWPSTRWWTCPLMGVSLPQWTALGRCGPSTGRLHYTWGVGALSRTHLPPLQALLTTTLLSITPSPFALSPPQPTLPQNHATLPASTQTLLHPPPYPPSVTHCVC